MPKHKANRILICNRLLCVVDSGDGSQKPNLIMTELNVPPPTLNHNGTTNTLDDKTKAKTVESHEQNGSFQSGCQATTIYYPSPYASMQVTSNGHFNGHSMTLKPMTVTLVAEGRCQELQAGQVRVEESQYATVKRTPRINKAERNIYDYPSE